MKRSIGLVVACAALFGCHREPPACQPQTLTELEAAYLAEMTASCAGQSFDGCDARPAIEAKYASRREEWIACH